METHHHYVLRIYELAGERDGRGLTAWELSRLDEWHERAEAEGESFRLSERMHEVCSEIEEKLS